MGYRVVGKGPQFPNGYEVRASTAAEARDKLKATQGLCGSAVVYDDSGRQLSWPDLNHLIAAEAEAQRKQLKTMER